MIRIEVIVETQDDADALVESLPLAHATLTRMAELLAASDVALPRVLAFGIDGDELVRDFRSVPQEPPHAE